MDITISDKVDRNKVNLIFSAIDFFAKKLIHGNARNVLEIHVEPMPTSYKGFVGMCEWDVEYINPRSFVITVDLTQQTAYIIETLAHEMVHVRQFVSGDLRHRYRSRYKILWHKNEVDINNVEYMNLPWEVEAFDMQYSLTKDFILNYENYL